VNGPKFLKARLSVQFREAEITGVENDDRAWRIIEIYGLTGARPT
jgi:hypothetical protein